MRLSTWSNKNGFSIAQQNVYYWCGQVTEFHAYFAKLNKSKKITHECLRNQLVTHMMWYRGYSIGISRGHLSDTWVHCAELYSFEIDCINFDFEHQTQTFRASKIIEPMFIFSTFIELNFERKNMNEIERITNALKICNLKMHWTVTNVKARRGPYLTITKSLKIKSRRRKEKKTRTKKTK